MKNTWRTTLLALWLAPFGNSEVNAIASSAFDARARAVGSDEGGLFPKPAQVIKTAELWACRMMLSSVGGEGLSGLVVAHGRLSDEVATGGGRAACDAGSTRVHQAGMAARPWSACHRTLVRARARSEARRRTTGSFGLFFRRANWAPQRTLSTGHEGRRGFPCRFRTGEEITLGCSLGCDSFYLLQ